MIGRLPFHSLSPRHPGTRIPSQIRTETAVQSKRGYVASISSASLASSETSIPSPAAIRRTVPQAGLRPASMWLSHVGCSSALCATSS